MSPSHGSSLDREEGEMRMVRGSGREEARWVDKDHRSMGKSIKMSYFSVCQPRAQINGILGIFLTESISHLS